MHGTHGSLIKILRLLFSVLVICLSLLFLIELYSLHLLNGQAFMIAALLVLLVDAAVIAGLNFFTRKRGVQVLCSILVVALACGYGLGSWYLTKTTSMLGDLTTTNEQVKNVIDVFALKDSDITDVKDLNGKTVGVLESINLTGTQKALADLSSQGVDVTPEAYSNFGPLANALYEKDVDAIIINEIYLPNIVELESFTDFKDQTQVVYQYDYFTDVTVNTASVSDITTEPFTVLMNGSDSRGKLGDTDRSDVNMLVTINPETKIVLMVSIPRDSYVETACDPEYDCQQGAFDKLTHTGLHTYHTTQKTIENFMDVDINYVFRANFSAVVDIVDALGGIDVEVAPGYAVDYFWTNDMFGTDYGVEEGINHLNGQAALCYARERYAYTEGDFQRIKNQQQVMEAIAKKVASPEVIVRYTNLLDTIKGNFWTDLSQKEIMDFIQFQISNMPDWTFISYSLSGESDSMYCAEAYNYASVIVLDQNTVKTAKELIDAVKDGKSATDINEMMEEAADLAPDYTLQSNLDVPEIDMDSDDYYPAVQDIQSDIYPADPGIYYPPEQAPVYQEPVYQEPVYQEPVYQEPVYQEPVYQEPVADQQQPTVQQPNVQQPVVQEPVVQYPDVPAVTPPAGGQTQDYVSDYTTGVLGQATAPASSQTTAPAAQEYTAQ